MTAGPRLLALYAALAVAGAATPARADGEAPAIAVLETLGTQVPPEAAFAVTRQLYATVARLGYRTVPEAETARLTAALGPRALAPLDLLAIARAAHAAHAVQATLSSEGDRYVALLTLVTTVRNEPRFERGAADPAGLEANVDHLARSLLPAVIAEPPEAPLYGGPPTQTGVRLALQTEAAFGLSSHFFYNHFAGGRVDYAFTHAFALGAYVGYANLKGKQGRAQNVLPYLQLEYRLAFASDQGVLVPLRFGSGYLPKNGPFLRLSAGPSFPLGNGIRLGFDLLAPTFIIVHDRTVVSLDVAAEVSFGI